MSRRPGKGSRDEFEPGQLVWINHRDGALVWLPIGDIYGPGRYSLTPAGTPLLIVRRVTKGDLDDEWKQWFKNSKAKASFFESMVRKGWICILEDQLVLAEQSSLKKRKR